MVHEILDITGLDSYYAWPFCGRPPFLRRPPGWLAIPVELALPSSPGSHVDCRRPRLVSCSEKPASLETLGRANQVFTIPHSLAIVANVMRRSRIPLFPYRCRVAPETPEKPQKGVVGPDL